MPTLVIRVSPDANATASKGGKIAGRNYARKGAQSDAKRRYGEGPRSAENPCGVVFRGVFAVGENRRRKFRRPVLYPIELRVQPSLDCGNTTSKRSRAESLANRDIQANQARL